MTLPDFNLTQELLIGGVSWSLLVTLVITFVTRYVRPLTEKQIELLKGSLMAFGYVVLVFITNAPEYRDVVMFVLTVMMMFLMSTGIYELSKESRVSLKSNIKEG